MTNVKTLHLTLSNFASFCNQEIREGGDKIHMRLFLPPISFHILMSDCEESPLVIKKPEWRFNEESNFEAIYHYVNILLEIEESKTFKLELVEGNQVKKKELSPVDNIIPGRGPNIDHKKPIFA